MRRALPMLGRIYPRQFGPSSPKSSEHCTARFPPVPLLGWACVRLRELQFQPNCSSRAHSKALFG